MPVGVPGADGCGTLVDIETSVFPAAGLGSSDGYGSMEFEVDDKIRVPALVDHANGDLMLMEMGAVVLYLVERYAGKSTEILHGLSTSKEGESMVQEWAKSKYGLCPAEEEGRRLARQWLFFSVSGTYKERN